ncbi:helix-turn-helix domain-containing protein [Lactiplantibacillus plantarum]|uniref:helix-turn-helix domain-containing protein n=1 Tax=Lactiplantibacillus plantarum TaxID=1590 RepID=UPI003D2B7E44
MTQSQVAEQLHVSRKTISGWENDHSFPDVGSLVQLSDIYDVRLDDLMRDDHLLAYYKEVERLHQKSRKWVVVSYRCNFLLLVLGYIDYLRPFGIRTFLVPFLVLVNAMVLLSYFSDWQRFKSGKLRVGIVITVFIAFIAEILINTIVPSYLNELAHAVDDGPAAIIGEVAGRLLVTSILILSLVLAIFLKPKQRERS